MPKSLASRLSSPKELLKRLSFPSPISSDQDLSEFAIRHHKRHGHLPVQEQITRIQEDAKADRLRRRHKPIPRLVPRRKPLPPPVPHNQPLPPAPPKPREPLSARVEERIPTFVPLALTIPTPLPTFARTNPVDILAIVEKKVTAVVKRIQALFDRKNLLEDSPHHLVAALQREADKLEWILEHINHEGVTWTYAQQRDIDHFCHAFAHIRFEKLKENFPRILKAVAGLESFGYLAWIKLNV